MTSIRLLINDKEFQINYKLLAAIARELPNEKQYEELARTLVDLDIPSITALLLENDALQDRYDEIWEKGNLEIRQGLSTVHNFLKKLNDVQAQDIITMDNPTILRSIASWGELLFPDDDEVDQALRISPAMAHKLMQHIINHPDSSIKAAAAENYAAPHPYIVPMKECCKIGVVPQELIKAMTAEDVALLPNAHRDVWEHIAEYVEDITNEDVRNTVAEWLASSSDPAVRLALADNSLAPQHILKRLSTDEDRDVAQAAQNSLESRHIDDDDDWEDD